MDGVRDDTPIRWESHLLNVEFTNITRFHLISVIHTMSLSSVHSLCRSIMNRTLAPSPKRRLLEAIHKWGVPSSIQGNRTKEENRRMR